MNDHRIDITVEGVVNQPLRWTAICVCGWRAMTHGQQEAEHQGRVHRRLVTVMTARCDGCADVIPVRMMEEVGPDMLCPECYNIVEPVADPAALITDLQMLEQELRPSTWDGP